VCPGNWLCAAGTCVYGYPISAGTITVTGLRVPDLVVGASAEALPDDLFADDALVTVRAEGATVPAFELMARATPVLDFAPAADTFVLSNDAPTVLAWTPSPGASYRLSIRSPHNHGGGVHHALECEGLDTGGVTIAPELARLMPELLVPNCLGLTCEVTVLQRFNRQAVSLAGGEIELIVGSQRLVWADHPAP
jgi:hypothetical protein